VGRGTCRVRQKSGRHRLILSDLTNQLYWQLRKGQLIAHGLGSNAPTDAPRRPVIAERWADLQLDVRRSTAEGAGLIVTQLLIFDTGLQTPSLEGPKGFSEAKLREWYISRVESFEGRTPPSRDDDYRDARKEFWPSVGKRAVQAERRELAPADWTRRARRRLRMSNDGNR
jgi:hypothetical protein